MVLLDGLGKKANKIKKSLQLLQFFDGKYSIYFCVALCSFYVLGMLKLTDHLLAQYISGYEYSGNYMIGLVVFFFASLSYLHLARRNQWMNWRYYIIGSVVVFFPLVFIASALKVFLSPNAEYIRLLNQQYCEIESSTTLCGVAFASLVSSMSLRALPVVLTTPAIFWCILIRPGSLGSSRQ